MYVPSLSTACLIRAGVAVFNKFLQLIPSIHLYHFPSVPDVDIHRGQVPVWGQGVKSEITSYPSSFGCTQGPQCTGVETKARL